MPLSTDDNSVIITLTWDTPVLDVNQNYTFIFWKPEADTNNMNAVFVYDTKKPQNTNTISGEAGSKLGVNFAAPGDWRYKVYQGDVPLNRNFPKNSLIYEGYFYMYRCPKDKNGQPTCPRLRMDGSAFKPNTKANLYIEYALPNQVYTAWFDGDTTLLFSGAFQVDQSITPPTATTQVSVGNASDSPKTLCMKQGGVLGNVNLSLGLACDFKLTGITVSVNAPDASISQAPIQSNQTAGIPTGEPPTPTFPLPSPPCNIQTARNGSQTCKSVNTAFGEIPTNPAEFIKKLFGILLSASGGIALVLIIISGYNFIASQGNPEKIQGARETLTSAIVGLLFIIFSMVILEVIGVDILHIPGLTH